jgi:biotin transport system substrate-specific component
VEIPRGPVTGALAERGWDRRFLTTVAAMLLGSAVIFAAGLAALSAYVPRPQLLAAGLLPFVPGDLVKSALAALVLPRLWRVARRGGSRS